MSREELAELLADWDASGDPVDAMRVARRAPVILSHLDALEKVAEAAGRVLATTTYWKPARRILIATGKGKAFSHAANDMAMALAQLNEVAAESGEDAPLNGPELDALEAEGHG